MKKILSVLIVLLFCFVNETNFVLGNENSDSFITKRNYQIANEIMKSRGYSLQNIEFLYDGNDNPKYLLATSEDGYAIIYAKNNMCIEAGEGNPYEKYMNNRKYYCGILNYCVEIEGRYYYINEDTFLNKLSYNSDFENILNDANYQYSTNSLTKTVLLVNSYNYIQRMSFAYNHDSTCSAIACSLALNYLDRQYNNNIVPYYYQLGYLLNTKPYYFDGDENSTAYTNWWINYPYKNAENFKNYLKNGCNMSAFTFGIALVNGVNTYKNSSSLISSTNFSITQLGNPASYYLSSIKQNIQNSFPALLTSTIYSGYSNHTMLIYGYEDYSDGSTYYVVHTGWASSLTLNGNTGKYYHPYRIVNSSITNIGWGYLFNI